MVTVVDLAAQDRKPVVSAVANVASYSQGPIAPGAMVVLFGSGLGPTQLVNLQLDDQGRVASTLSEVQVLFDGIAAPLVYVSASQVAALVPYGVEGRTTTQVQVSFRGVVSDAFPKTIAPTAPAVFSADSSGKGQGSISNLDGSPNSTTNPVTPGSYITIYITGYGQTDPPGSDGVISAGIANVKTTVAVTIAGRSAKVIYAGSSPGFVNGFAQVNAQVPSDLPYGGNLPLLVRVGDAVSQGEITVAVAGPPAPTPGAPRSVSATPIAPSQIRVRWTPADESALRFHVERQVGGSGSFTRIAEVSSTILSFVDPNVTADTQYAYRVRAENEYGYSTYSTVASTQISTPQVAPPTKLQAVAVGPNQVNLSWNSANTNATNFQIERKTGATGTFAIVATIVSSMATYQDLTVSPNISYTYRMRSQAASGVSPYSDEITVNTPPIPPPSAPTLTATAVTSSVVRLAWNSTVTGIVRFRIERRSGSGQFLEITQPGPTVSTVDDSGLMASTTYSYRIRLDTAQGTSPFSAEVSATTRQGVPIAPSRLRTAATSPTQISLTWINNSPDASSVRVESRTGSSAFADIGPASSLTSSTIINNQPNTTYTFRVRAQNAVGYSPYSNESTVTTPAIPKTIFLIHGIGQGSYAMQGLYNSLTGASGVDLTRFRVDAGFDFSECADPTLVSFCPANCSISAGAQKLAQYIVNANPPGDIVLIGFSMGGLIARDMMANNRINLNGRKISALITLGTPNLGYPYTVVDTILFCTNIVKAMDGNWRSQQATNTVVLSDYLLSLYNQWPSTAYPGNSGLWLAASGRSCSNPTRTINVTTGCRDRNPYSDGVVCDDSATYSINTSAGAKPNRYWQDPNGIYVHTNTVWGAGTSVILCGNSGNPTTNPPLSNPPSFGPLFAAMKGLLNGL